MVTELVTFKLDKNFLREVDKIYPNAGFSSRTDFIRNALRKGVDEIKLKESMERLSKFKGISKNKTTDEKIHKVREEVVKKMIKERGWDLD